MTTEVIEERKAKDADANEMEIRLSDIIQFIKDHFRYILIGGLIGLIVGVFYAYSQPDMFKVEVTIMPEVQGRGVAGISGFTSGLGGLDNTSTLDSRPDLYPNVLASMPFAISMLKQRVVSKKLEATVTLEEFMTKTSTTSIIDKIRGLFSSNDDNASDEKADKAKSKNAIQLTAGQYGLIKAVQASVTSSFDRKTGIITVTATEPDPVVAASVADLSLKYLTDYIIAYRTDKARRRVHFLTEQVRDAKGRYEKAQFAFSNYRDRNVSVYLNTAKIEEQRLQADYLLEQSVYNDLARQLEQAKIKVEEDTPTFKILEPPVVPIGKSGPKRNYIILGFLIVGAVIGFGIVCVQQLLIRK